MQLVTADMEEGVAIITLNRPDVLNALSQELMRSLDGVLDDVVADDRARAVVITGAGKAFCAGGDLFEFAALYDNGAAKLLEALEFNQRVFEKLEAIPVPVVAAVNGVAVAGGLELVLCCDVVVAAASARLGDGHANYSILPTGGSTARLQRKIPPNIAMHLLFSGKLHPAQEFMNWGLVNKVVSDPDVRYQAVSLARAYARHSRHVLGAIKRLTLSNTLPVGELARSELSEFADYANLPDLADGFAKFTARRRDFDKVQTR